MTLLKMHRNILKQDKSIQITKASGEEEPFLVSKLQRSLYNAGAGADAVANIVADIQQWVYPGITTKKIYQRAFSLLRKREASMAVKYKLKQAIFDIGPSGYPFEVLVGQIFKKKGFHTEVGVIVNGHCITHEMDVIATRDKSQHLVECKYHKDQGKQESIQVPLYVRSRVDDIIRKRKEMPGYRDFSFSGWVITNTRFSSDSMRYGKCSGLNLLAWDYPEGKGLKELIEKYKVYPITILNQLNAKQKRYLLDKGVVTCDQLLKSSGTIADLELTKSKYRALMQELNTICTQ